MKKRRINRGFLQRDYLAASTAKRSIDGSAASS